MASPRASVWFCMQILLGQIALANYVNASSSDSNSRNFPPRFDLLCDDHPTAVVLTSNVDSTSKSEVKEISCYANGHPLPDAYSLLVSGEEVSSSNSSYRLQISASSLASAANVLPSDSGIYQVQCSASNTLGTTLESSIYLQVVEIPQKRVISHSTDESGFSKIDCHEQFAKAATQSRQIGSSMLDSRVHWAVNGVPILPNFPKMGSFIIGGQGDSDNYLITYHNQLVLLNFVSQPVASFSCLFGGEEISRYDVYSPTEYKDQSPDEFLLAPTDVEAIERVTKYVQFDCVGPRMCKPDWYFKDVRVLQSSYQLRISYPDVSQAGVYSCQCALSNHKEEDGGHNAGYYAARSATLRVQKMPIRKTLGDYRLTLRMLENTTLNCEIDWQEQISDEQTEYVETPALQYWWLRNGKIISNTLPGDDSWQQKLEDGGKRLMLFSRNSVQDTLSGVYQCQVVISGKLPLIQTSMPISVQVDNRELIAFASWYTDPQVVEGGTATLQCNIEGGSVEKAVSWLFTSNIEQEEEQLDVDDRDLKFRSRSFLTADHGLVYELKILVASIEDSGLYKCQVWDKADNKVVKSRAMQLTVLHRTTLISGLVDSWGARLARVEMYCIVRIDENMSSSNFRWLFSGDNTGGHTSGGEVLSEDDYFIQIWEHPANDNRQEVIKGRLSGTRMVNTTLTISKMEPERAGTYTCEIDSPAGSVSSSAVFTVHARPSKPPKVQARQMEDRVCIKWPNVNSSEPISHVIVDYKKVEEYGKRISPANDDWITYAHKYKNPVCLTSLKPWSTYVFKVSLNNSLGMSEFSDESDPLIMPENVPDGAPENVNVVALNSSSLQVTYDRIPQELRNGEILGYTIFYTYAEAPDDQWWEIHSKNDTFTAVISNLGAYERILIKVRGRTSVGYGKMSEIKEARTKEGIPSRNIYLSRGTVTATSIGISWFPMYSHEWKGRLKNYLIYVESVDADFSSTINRTIEVDPIVSAYTIRDLTPHTKYSISGSFFNGVYHPAEKSNVLNITTKESTPGPVSDVRWFDVTHESIRLVWSEPVEPNGIITGYSIQISEMVQNQPNKEISFSEKREGKMIHNITVDADTNERWIVNLTESTDYELEIAAMTKLGSGVLRKFKFSSGVPPELPQPPISINILNVSSRSAKIKFLHGFNGHTSISKWIVEIKKEWRQSWKDCLVHEVLDSPEITSLDLPDILTASSQYRLRMIACNVEGCSEPSVASPAFQTEADIPAVFPANVVARPLPVSQLLITWTRLLKEDWNDDITRCNFILNYSSSSGDQNRVVLSPNQTSYLLQNVSAERAYTIEVQAKNSRGVPNTSPPTVSVKTVNTDLCNLSSSFSYNRDAHWAIIHLIGDRLSFACAQNEIHYYQAQILYKGEVVQSVRVPSVAKPSANFTNLYANVTYYVRVAAMNGAGKGKWSPKFEIIPFLSPPDHPENVWVQMEKTPNDECSFGIYGLIEKELHIQNISYSYRIGEHGSEFSDYLAVPDTKIEDVKAQWFHEELKPCPFNSVLYIDLSLCNAEGESPTRSFEIELPKQSNKKWPVKPIEPIRDLEQTVDSRWAQLHWKYERLIDVQNFTVSVLHDVGTAINEKPELSVTTSELHTKISGLIPHEKYKVAVIANGYFGKSSDGISTTFMTTSDAPDYPPEVPQYIVENGRVVFPNLLLPRGMNGVFQGFELQYRALDTDDTLHTLSLNYRDKLQSGFLKVGTSYQMRLAVRNKVGMSPWSQYFYPFIEENDIKNAPRNVQVVYHKSGPTFLFVTWEEPSFDTSGNSEADHIHGYQVCRWKKKSQPVDAEQNDDRTAYGIKIENSNSFASNGYVEQESASTSLDVDDKEVSKTCKNVTYSPTKANVTLEYLEGFSEYYIRVAAFNSRGLALQSETLVAKTDIGVPAVVPRLDTHVLTGSLVEVTWKPPVHSHGPILRYYITYSLSPSRLMQRSVDYSLGDDESTSEVLTLSVKVNGAQRSKVLNGLQPDKIYEMKIEAKTQAGKSDPKTVMFFTGAQKNKPPPPPGKPTILQNSEEVITVNWNEPKEESKLEPVINYSIYLLYRDSRTYFIDALILNKTLTRDRQISVNFNSSQWLWNLLEQNENVWIAVAAINRNGQGVLGAWAEYRPNSNTEEELIVAKASAGFLNSNWLILSTLCGLLLICVIASATVIILICHKIKSSDGKSIRRNRNQVYKGAPHDSGSHFLLESFAGGSSLGDSTMYLDTMMQRIQEAAELDFMPMPQDRNSLASTTLGHSFPASSSIHAGSVQGLNYAAGMNSNEQIGFSGIKHPNTGSCTLPANNQLKFGVTSSKGITQFQNTGMVQQPPFMHEYSFPNRSDKPMSPPPRTRVGYTGGGFDETVCTSGVYSMPTSSNEPDFSEERTEMDSDSSKSFSHQPDIVDDHGNSFSSHPVSRFPSTFAPDASNESLPMGTEMGTFGRSHTKKRQQQNTASAGGAPVNISQTRVPLHMNASNNRAVPNGTHAPSASYIPPVSLQATAKQLNLRERPVLPSGDAITANVNGGAAENGGCKSRHGSVSRPMASFRASIDEDEDSI